jgi:2-amino-4-hydroxy-6-hydroxymethyldihydropteridine diphosphokinase
MARVCLLLGSNIQPEAHLPLAVAGLNPWIRVERVSAVYETPAVGSAGPNFLNAAVLGETILTAQALKDQVLRPLEARLGRVRTSDKNAARTIDLDIIVWGDEILDPALGRYAHLAVPVADLIPDLCLPPNGEMLSVIAARLVSRSAIRMRADVALQPPETPRD